MNLNTTYVGLERPALASPRRRKAKPAPAHPGLPERHYYCESENGNWCRPVANRMQKNWRSSQR